MFVRGVMRKHNRHESDGRIGCAPLLTSARECQQADGSQAQKYQCAGFRNVGQSHVAQRTAVHQRSGDGQIIQKESVGQIPFGHTPK